MSWIKLTQKINGKKVAYQRQAFKNAELEEIEDKCVKIDFGLFELDVTESIDEIIEQFKDEQDSEWIENTGKAPDGDLVIEAKLIGDASTFDFDLDSFLPINEYKILGKR